MKRYNKVDLTISKKFWTILNDIGRDSERSDIFIRRTLTKWIGCKTFEVVTKENTRELKSDATITDLFGGNPNALRFKNIKSYIQISHVMYYGNGTIIVIYHNPTCVEKCSKTFTENEFSRVQYNEISTDKYNEIATLFEDDRKPSKYEVEMYKKRTMERLDTIVEVLDWEHILSITQDEYPDYVVHDYKYIEEPLD